jgi:prepilin-type N-terminal cleavage/methylation domain-containing protein/prepilin-type processing-associated H-X9-DG protein
MILRKKGFTLIELLVVMAIIGMLASALVLSLSKAGKIATDMKCKANLKNLAQAVQAYVVQNGHYPEAYPHETDDIDRYPPTGRICQIYKHTPAWVNWVGPGYWGKDNSGIDKSQKSAMTIPTISGSIGYNSITNGALWSYTGKDFNTYLCPAYKKAAVAAGVSEVWRSYVMNYRFNWRDDDGDAFEGPRFHWIGNFVSSGKSTDRNPERVLLFAELPADDIDLSEEAVDGSIDPDGANETIGFNHLVGKRKVAHVVFVDGHVGVLMEPRGSSEADLLSLTRSLCKGAEIDMDILQKMR